MSIKLYLKEVVIYSLHYEKIYLDTNVQLPNYRPSFVIKLGTRKVLLFENNLSHHSIQGLNGYEHARF